MPEPDDGRMLPDEMWDEAVDPDLPPGIVAFRRDDGTWDRYPLVEFIEDEYHPTR